MPYRKIPNSDEGRLKALQSAKNKAENTPAGELAFEAETRTRLNTFFEKFEKEVQERGAALSEQADATASKDKVQATVRMYISHFIQVFNLCIDRGVYSAADRAYYDLAVNQEDLPSLSTESDVTLWGKNLIVGEAARMAAGGTTMTNPSITDVGEVYDEYLKELNKQSKSKDQYDKEQEDVAALRSEADDIIIDIWDTVEFTHRKDEPSSRRRKSREYGVVYVSRQGEEAEEGVLPPDQPVSEQSSPALPGPEA